MTITLIRERQDLIGTYAHTGIYVEEAKEHKDNHKTGSMMLAGAKARAIAIPVTVMSGVRTVVAVPMTIGVVADGGVRYCINLGNGKSNKRNKAKRKMLAGLSLIPWSVGKLVCNTITVIAPELTLGKLKCHRKMYHISEWYGNAIGGPFKRKGKSYEEVITKHIEENPIDYQRLQ